jgi:hypothetical protein
MPYGIQTFDSAGNTIMDSSTRTGVIIGSITLPNTNGTQTHSGIPNGTPIWFLNIANNIASDKVPVISSSYSSGNFSISWTWVSSGNSGNPPLVLTYGIY